MSSHVQRTACCRSEQPAGNWSTLPAYYGVPTNCALNVKILSPDLGPASRSLRLEKNITFHFFHSVVV